MVNMYSGVALRVKKSCGVGRYGKAFCRVAIHRLPRTHTHNDVFVDKFRDKSRLLFGESIVHRPCCLQDPFAICFHSHLLAQFGREND
jgi:hypothetical protein